MHKNDINYYLEAFDNSLILDKTDPANCFISEKIELFEKLCVKDCAKQMGGSYLKNMKLKKITVTDMLHTHMIRIPCLHMNCILKSIKGKINTKELILGTSI